MIPGALRRRLSRSRERRSGVFADAGRGDYQHLALREGNPVQRFWHAGKWPLVKSAAAPGAGDRILDVGAGSSEIATRLAQTCSRVCALDAALAPLRFTRGAVAPEGSRTIDLVAGNAGALPFRDASFDRILSLEVFEHLPEETVARSLAELRRLLAPGGTLFVTTPNYRSLWPLMEFAIDHLGGAARMAGDQHITRFHRARLRAVLVAAGFRVRRIGSVYHASPFLAPLAPDLAKRVLDFEMRRGGALGPILFALAERA